MNHLIRQIIVITCFLIPLASFAQTSADEYSKVSFSIRGKWLYLPSVENVYRISYSYGGEIFIGKHYAIGIDGDKFTTRRRWEQGQDEGLIAMEVTTRSSIYADYKYIYPLNETFSLYGQAYSRFRGKRKYWLDRSGKHEQYVEPEDPDALLERKDGTFTDFGIGIGGKWYFNGGNAGLDVNLNVYKRIGSYRHTVYSSMNGWTTDNVDDSPVSVYLRVAFFYHFFRYRKLL